MIRRACEKDTDKILDLLVQVDMVHHNGRPDIFKGPATKYTADELAKMYTDDERPIFVYEKDGSVLGYAFCIFKQLKNDNVLTDIKTLYIDDLCVDEKSRGMHVGKSLYEYVLDFAKKSGCYNVTLNVWSLNKSAMAFYEKCGLVPQKVCMEKIL